MAISFEDNEKRSGPPPTAEKEAKMPNKIGDEEYEIEVKIENSTEKAWLIVENMSGKEVWAPKSQCHIIRERDADGNVLMACTAWWIRKAGLIV
jgi:hypothetical protein